MSLRRSLLLLKAKVASVARNQQLRPIKNASPAGSKNVRPEVHANPQEQSSGTKVANLLNFGVKYGPKLFNCVSWTISNGPKVVFGLLVCGSIGYLYYLKKHYGMQFGNFKQGMSDKYDGVKNKIGNSIDSIKTAAGTARERAGQSIDSARDTVKESYEKVKSVASDLNPVPAISEGASAAKDRVVKGKEELADRVAKLELKGPWMSTPSNGSDLNDKSSEPSVSISEKLNSLKQKVADKVPSFGRESADSAKVKDGAEVTNQPKDAVAEVESVAKISETMKSKVAVAKKKLSAWSKEGNEN